MKLPNEGFVLGTWLSEKDKARAFKQTPRKIFTYASLKHPKTKLMLKLHHQHFEMGRTTRYTQPSYVLALVLRNPRRINVNFAVPVRDNIKKFAFGGNWQRDNFINSPHTLTHIIYFALGMLDQIPRTQELEFLMEQVELIHNIDKVKKRQKKKRERQEQKLKETTPPAKKSQVPLDTMSGLFGEEHKKDIPFEHKESEMNTTLHST